MISTLESKDTLKDLCEQSLSSAYGSGSKHLFSFCFIFYMFSRKNNLCIIFKPSWTYIFWVAIHESETYGCISLYIRKASSLVPAMADETAFQGQD